LIGGGVTFDWIWCEIRLRPVIAFPARPDRVEKRDVEDAGVVGVSESADETDAERDGPAAVYEYVDGV